MSTIDKVLTFDLWGEYASFRRPYTTTSQVTYPFPTRTSLSGLLASMLGFERDTYYEDFSYRNSRIGIQLLSKIKKMSLPMNLIDTKKGYYLWDIPENPRTQIRHEILKDVQYRIYVWLKSDKYYENLRKRLRDHTSFYTPYLGMAPFIANFRFVNEYTSVRRKENKEVSVLTVVPEEYGIKPLSNHRYGRINMPSYMDVERTPSYTTLIYDSCMDYDPAHQIPITRGEYFEIEDGNIVLL